MGASMARRLVRGGHACVVYDRDAAAAAAVVADGARAAPSLDALVAALAPPRAIWVMVPAAAVDDVIAALAPRLAPGDVIVDGGNTHYHDDLRRAGALAAAGVHLVDVGTSGGVWGGERGYCLMIGGERAVVERLDPIFRALAPGVDAAPRTAGAGDPTAAEHGYLHCGPTGAGHFVKMVHNGIEYGLMAAYAEGLNLLRHANVGAAARADDAETAPLAAPERFRYDLDVASIAELWRRGSVIGSWLLDLAARALRDRPDLDGYAGRVADSGEGRWAAIAAIEAGVPAPVMHAALAARFSSRGHDDFARKLLSALREQFGGHRER